MLDVHDQIREYSERLDDEVRPLTAAEILDGRELVDVEMRPVGKVGVEPVRPHAPLTRTRSQPASRPLRWWRGPVVATAVMTLVMLTGGILWLLRADPLQSEDVVTQPSTPVAPTEPVTSADDAAATTVVVPESMVPGPWTSHRIVGDLPGIGDVVSFGPGFVVVGVTFTQGDVRGRGQIWTSVDGMSWSEVADEGVLFDEGHYALGILANDSGGVVWGTNNRQGGTVILTSSNGIAWDLITTRQPPLEGHYTFTDGIALASGGYLLYGVGSNCYAETGDCFPVDAPRVLVSDDGVSWELIPTPVTFTAITQTTTGDLLAVGGFISEPTTWISGDDGQTWQQHGPDRTIEEGPSAQVWILESTPYGLIAAGLDPDQRSMLWLSEDGRTFTPVHELPVGPEPKGYRAVNAITFGGRWVIAVGSLRTDAGDQQLMWASRDGSEWRSVPLEGTYLGGAALDDIAYRDSVFIAVGNHAFPPANAGIPLVLRWESSTG